jgi:hypothetical protein
VILNGTAKTFVSLDFLDPQYVAGSDASYNTSINFSAIKFEYANYNDDDETLEWQDLNNIYIFDAAQDVPVREDITNGQYTPPDGLTRQAASRNFLFDLIEILNATPTDRVHHKFRVSYKNSNNVEFSNTIESNVITIDKPEIPSVDSVKMRDHNKLEIVIPPYTHNNNIIGSTLTDTTNNNKNDVSTDAAVIQLEKIEFKITKKEDSDGSGSVLDNFNVYRDQYDQGNPLVILGKDTDTNYYSINQKQDTQNLENLKFYVEINHNDIAATSGTVNYEIQVKVRNTINSEFTAFSEPNSSFTITEPKTSILITDPVIFSLSSTNNNTLDIKLGSEDHFTDNLLVGSRGVTAALIINNPAYLIPTIKEFLWESNNLKDLNINSTLTENDVTTFSTGIATDASGYLDKANFYDTLKYDGTNSEKTEDLNISIKYKNFYINAYNESPITSEYRLRATAPSSYSS